MFFFLFLNRGEWKVGVLEGGCCISFLNTARQSQTPVYKRPATPSNGGSSCEDRPPPPLPRDIIKTSSPHEATAPTFLHTVYRFVSTHTHIYVNTSPPAVIFCLFSFSLSLSFYLSVLPGVFLQQALRGGQNICACVCLSLSGADSNWTRPGSARLGSAWLDSTRLGSFFLSGRPRLCKQSLNGRLCRRSRRYACQPLGS